MLGKFALFQRQEYRARSFIFQWTRLSDETQGLPPRVLNKAWSIGRFTGEGGQCSQGSQLARVGSHGPAPFDKPRRLSLEVRQPLDRR